MNEQTLFQEALDRPAHERTVFLRAACGDNQQLLRRTEKLLNLHEQSGSFMNLPVGQLEEAIEQVGQDQSGNQIGPYKLLELIGEGGMGSVYMAEQTTPVRRRVALKLIKPGMDSRQVIARFEAERQALSLMDHPNIAKVLDAGTAHQKGVIHRDIKPNNVLVAEHCRSQPAKLPTLMRGELDWIVMKAMEKDRDRRYGTANSLALDIESFLKNEAVQAGPPSTLYRFRKFARRNRVWLLTASVVACAVLLGLVTASWQYLRAKRAERQSLALAQTERELREAESWQRERAQAAEDQATADAARARAMNEFLIHDLLRLASAEGQAGAELTVEPDIRLVTVLNRASERLAARFQDQPVVRAALQRTLASAYQGLGRYEQASALWKQAIVSEPQDNEQGRRRVKATARSPPAKSWYDGDRAMARPMSRLI